MNKFIRNLLTTTDNKDWELGRVLWALGSLALVVYQGIAIWSKGQTFSPIEFGTGIAAVLAAGGFGVSQKDKAHPCNHRPEEPK